MREVNLQTDTKRLEPCEDAISRQAAIDEWKNDFKGYVNALNIPRDDYKGIMAYIDELPAAQPDWNEMMVICDCCGHAIHVKRQ